LCLCVLVVNNFVFTELEEDMKHEMIMPKMGESITEGTIVKWLKNEGDTVANDEIILEISTDKVDSEIPTPVAGIIEKILANEGDTIEVGNVIAHIETEAKSQGEPAKVEKTVKTAPAEPVPANAVPANAVPANAVPANAVPANAGPADAGPVVAETKKSAPYFSPVVLSIARNEGISRAELESISGSGLNSRITKKDVLNYLENKEQAEAVPVLHETPVIPAGGTEIIPMDHIRKKIAQHMVQTVHTSPHVGLYLEVDMFDIYTLREKNKSSFKRREGFNLTYMPFLAEASTKALKQFPLVNASLDGDNIVVKHFVNLGIAIATDKGLIVPVIKNADSLSLTGLARSINDLALRARSKKLKPDEVSGGTFSISNFGVYGTTIGFPLINQPQLAILGVGALKKRPVVINDAIAIRPVMYLSLVFDHRLIDGALGAQFLKAIGDYLQSYDPDTAIG
jgi:2-oxoglutarate dehydrogenase E2 component (dihydrolipoamide succinyltransferase)